MVKEDAIMRKKGLMALGLAVGMSLALPLLSYAGALKVDETGWQYQNDDGTYLVNRWEWLDLNNDGIAECYYFNEKGYLLMGTTTPDNYTVNENGAWTVDGVVQTKSVEIRVIGTGELRASDGTVIPQDIVDGFRAVGWSDSLIIQAWEEAVAGSGV